LTPPPKNRTLAAVNPKDATDGPGDGLTEFVFSTVAGLPVVRSKSNGGNHQPRTGNLSFAGELCPIHNVIWMPTAKCACYQVLQHPKRHGKHCLPPIFISPNPYPCEDSVK
jgi:hypothetical protein